MLTLLVTLLILLLVLCIVGYIGRALLRGLGAPAWADAVLVGVLLLIGLVIAARTFGVLPAGLA